MSAVAQIGGLDVSTWMNATRDRTEAALARVMPKQTVVPTKLHEAMRYATLGGGKRVRAMLVYAAGAWASANGSKNAALAVQLNAQLDAAACSVELIHAYSLVHDDLPAMDNDDLRRGRPTVHKAFDEATALLVGDALQALAFEVLANGPSAFAAKHVALLAHASGSIGMAGGQAIDLDSVGKPLSWPDLEVMHRAKTGALLRAAVVLGATAVHTPREHERLALDRYAAAVGLAFQVVDDVLDVETDSATLGKTAGKDAKDDKPTAVTTLGLGPAKALAKQLRDEADDALDALGGDVERLRDIASFIIGRSY
jgi:farnesyl diphosphate synthase